MEFYRISTAFLPHFDLWEFWEFIREAKAGCRNSHRNNARRLSMQRLQLTYKRGDGAMGRLGRYKKGANLIIPHQVEHDEGAMHHLHHHKKGGRSGESPQRS